MEKNLTTFISDIYLEEEDLAQAQIAANPTLKFAKFILTDDQPNLNKMRIPLEEFDNLIKSGVFMPVKMEVSSSKDLEHAFSLPLGVITNLKQEGNKIIGLAGLWTEERKDDIELIRTRTKEGKTVQLSWEVLYGQSREEDGVTALLDTSLRATTVVSMPAYAGRTPILAISSEQKSNTEVNPMDLEQLKTELDSVKAELEQAKLDLATKISEQEAVTQELETLRAYKSEIEKAKEEAERLASIVNKFKEAGIEKDENYFIEKKSYLLGIDEATLDFMIQELSTALSSAKASVEPKVKVPNILKDTVDYSDPKKLGEALRNLNKKQ